MTKKDEITTNFQVSDKYEGGDSTKERFGAECTVHTQQRTKAGAIPLAKSDVPIELSVVSTQHTINVYIVIKICVATEVRMFRNIEI